MFKKLFPSKNIFFSDFLNDYEVNKPQHVSVDISDDSLKSIWLLDEGKVIGIEQNKSKLILTNISGKTKRFETEEKFLRPVIFYTQKAILNKMEEAKECLHQFPNISQPTDGELKGEEWLKVTSHVLKESLKNAANDENLIIEAKIFIGKLKSDSEFSIRIQCYNLDYCLTFLNNGKLYVSVFDDKNFERGHSEKPSYNGEFFNNRPAILDEFLKLIIDICTHGNLL